MTSNCRSCDAPIRWAITTNGRRIPLDAASHPEGNLVIVDDVATRGWFRFDPTVHLVPKDQLDGFRQKHPDEPLYRSHFATCPNADTHRRNR